MWRLGKILRLIPGRDGVVRSAVVKVKSRNGVTKFRRPLQRLYPLEVTVGAKSATVPAEHGARAAITVVSDADIPDIQVHGIQN